MACVESSGAWRGYELATHSAVCSNRREIADMYCCCHLVVRVHLRRERAVTLCMSTTSIRKLPGVILGSILNHHSSIRFLLSRNYFFANVLALLIKVLGVVHELIANVLALQVQSKFHKRTRIFFGFNSHVDYWHHVETEDCRVHSHRQRSRVGRERAGSSVRDRVCCHARFGRGRKGSRQKLRSVSITICKT